MHRWLILLTALFAALPVAGSSAGVLPIPPAHADDEAPIGRLGDTLRVNTGTYVADITVSSVEPCDPPPGFGYTRSGIPVKSFPGSSVARADVVVRAVQVPNAFIMAKNFSFNGVTDFADAYKPRTSDAPDALDAVLVNAPQGKIVRGAVYWDAYRDPVTVVVLLDRKTGEHLAQWNL
ncbi:hypothetical protein [Mycobacterium sp.]|uniref:hypothetical protein n=1 Tax=Mycobacterium sp. TaxID=1785 RepID=UPI003A899154